MAKKLQLHGSFPSKAGENGGYYTPNVSNPDAETLEFTFTKSKEDMPAVPSVSVPIPSGAPEVHIGSEPPTNGEAIWINPDEDPEPDDTVSPEAIKQAVDAYLTENPPEVSGGGGGLPIVFNTEITEAVATFVADKDNNGNPFSLSYFELNIYIPVVKGAYPGGAIYINDGQPASCVTYYHDDASVKHCVCIRGDLIGGTVVFEKMGQNFAKGIDFGLLTKPITSINIKTFSETLRVPVGTKICLRGV